MIVCLSVSLWKYLYQNYIPDYVCYVDDYVVQLNQHHDDARTLFTSFMKVKECMFSLSYQSMA